MAGVNKAILIGNLGRDPEMKRNPGGSVVATFSLATSERFNDKSGQRQERTEWHNIVAWGKLAELANQYLKKGRTVYIEGRISTRSWEGPDKVKKYRTEIVASTIQFLGGQGGPAGESRGSEDLSSHSSAPAAASDEFDMPDSVSEAGPAAQDDLPF